VSLCPYLLDSPEFGVFTQHAIFFVQPEDFTTTQLISHLQNYFTVEGTFADHQMQPLQTQLDLFRSLISRMKAFLSKFLKIIQDTATKFEQNTARQLKFNHLLYEYEQLSIQTYSPHSQAEQLHDTSLVDQTSSEIVGQSELLLFTRPENKGVKK
jgi:hypothetical protein